MYKLKAVILECAASLHVVTKLCVHLYAHATGVSGQSWGLHGG